MPCYVAGADLSLSQHLDDGDARGVRDALQDFGLRLRFGAAVFFIHLALLYVINIARAILTTYAVANTSILSPPVNAREARLFRRF
jgi:hypothetical protein